MIRKGLIILSLLLIIGVLALREHAKTNDYGWFDGFWLNGNAISIAGLNENPPLWPRMHDLMFLGEYGSAPTLKYAQDVGYFLEHDGSRLALPVMTEAIDGDISSCVGYKVNVRGIVTAGLFSAPEMTRLDTVIVMGGMQYDDPDPEIRAQTPKFIACYISPYSWLHSEAPDCVGESPYGNVCSLMSRKLANSDWSEGIDVVCVEDIVSWMKHGECVWMSAKEASDFSPDQYLAFDRLVPEKSE